MIISKSLEISDNFNKVYSNLEDLFENETGNICFMGGAKIFDLLYKNYPHYIDLIRLTKFDSAISPETTNDMENLIYFPKNLLENFTIINKDTYEDNVKVSYLDQDVVIKIEYT